MKKLFFGLLLFANFEVTYSQNVGIGILTPLAPLHIKKDLEALRLQGSTPFISFYDNLGSTIKGFIQQYNDNLLMGTPASNPNGIMQFYLGNSAKITLLPSGAVGIGTDQVDDFRAVDYEGLTSLNISATQQLNKLIKNQQAIIETQQKQLALMEKRLAALETKLPATQVVLK